jgi:hypothetical protein
LQLLRKEQVPFNPLRLRGAAAPHEDDGGAAQNDILNRARVEDRFDAERRRFALGSVAPGLQPLANLFCALGVLWGMRNENLHHTFLLLCALSIRRGEGG